LQNEKNLKKLTQTQLILLVSLFLVLFDNYAFFTNIVKVYPFEQNRGFIISTAIVMYALSVLFFILISNRFIIKPLLIVVVIVSSMTNYFMNTYSVVIDDTMIRNTLQTDIHESLDLLSMKQVGYFVFLGLLPAYLIYKTEIIKQSFKSELLSRLKTVVIVLLIAGTTLFFFTKSYTSFVREHKPLRYTVNPLYWIYSAGKYISKTFNSGEVVVQPLGLDAKIVPSSDGRKKLVIMVVGEAARADHFSLNGYQRETNPLLKKEDIVNFSNVSSCGTSTAESVPCMFAIYPREDYTYKRGISTENALDVLKHTKDVAILWRDNNSDSKGVALRVNYEWYKYPNNNTICTDGECRDVGMLVGLDKFIEKNRDKNILIVLHQMGNHGPAYYKRYTKDFEKFKPVCKTNQLEECTQEEITNAYDNAILYTDYFLSQVIEFLKKYDNEYDTAMIYMADHGESLGENGIYLHGLPYFMAPKAQKHIGAVMWFGKNMRNVINVDALKKEASKAYSQDNLFHTLLGIFGVKSSVYNQKMDILSNVSQ
jgi:lipid A ethanolaminephosphotransferase